MVKLTKRDGKTLASEKNKLKEQLKLDNVDKEDIKNKLEEIQKSPIKYLEKMEENVSSPGITVNRSNKPSKKDHQNSLEIKTNK